MNIKLCAQKALLRTIQLVVIKKENCFALFDMPHTHLVAQTQTQDNQAKKMLITIKFQKKEG